MLELIRPESLPLSTRYLIRYLIIQPSMTYTTFSILLAFAIILTSVMSMTLFEFDHDASMSYADSLEDNNTNRFTSLVADAKPPLKQHALGVGFDKIVCKPDRILMMKPDTTSACVYTDSVSNLAQRGWSVIPVSIDWCVLLGFCTGGQNNDSSTIPDVSSSTSQRVLTEIPNISDQGYGLPLPWRPVTLFVDYPAEFKINQTETIYLNYSFMQKNRHTGAYINQNSSYLGDYQDVWFNLRTPDGVEILSEDYALVRTSFHYICPEGYNVHAYYKTIANLSTTGWHMDSIKVKFTKPMDQPRDFFSLSVDFNNVNMGLETVGDSVILLDERPMPDVSSLSGVPGIDCPSEVGEMIPADPNNPTYPPIPEYAYFLKHYIHTDNMTRYLLEDGLPQNYIDELFAEHPELITQKADGIAAQSSAAPAFIFVKDVLENKSPDGKDVPAANVSFCIYDVNLSTNVLN